MHQKIALLTSIFLVNICAFSCTVEPQKAEGSLSKEKEHSLAAEKQSSLTKEKIDSESSRLPPLLADRFKTKSGKKEFARAVLDRDLLAREAYARGYGDKREIKEEISRIEKRMIIKQMLADEGKKKEISEKEIIDYFERHRQQYFRKESIRFARIFVKSKKGDTGDKNNIKTLFDIRQKIKSGEKWENFAKNGAGPERVRAGDLGFFTIDDIQDDLVAKTVSSLKKIGDLSRPTKISGGVALYKLLDRKKARPASLKEVREEIRSLLVSRQQRKIFDELVKQVRIKYGSTDTLTSLGY